LSQGTPMLLMGDEFGRSQQGNNNAYCQDNELVWLRWGVLSQRDAHFKQFVEGLVRLRSAMPVLRQTRFLHGRPVGNSETEDVLWLKPDGTAMTPEDWNNAHTRSIGLLMSESNLQQTLILMNAHHEAVPFRLPDRQVRAWRIVVDTAVGRIEPDLPAHPAGEMFHLQGRSLFLLTAQT